MRKTTTRALRVTHPTPETLVPFALGAPDPATAQHVAACPACSAEVDRLREATALLRTPAILETQVETTQCLDESTIANFVEGALAPEAQAPVIEHLLTCARCRATVRSAGRLLVVGGVAMEAGGATPLRRGRRWSRWWVPLGVAAAATAILVLRPRSEPHDTSGLREPPLTSTEAPSPIAPRASVASADRLVWSSVPKVDLYRVRLYDGGGSLLWKIETADTSATLPDSVLLSPNRPYFWRVEAQTESNRWAASDLVEFRFTVRRQ